MKKILSVLLAVSMLMMSMAAFAEEKTVVRVASLKGPTSMGLVQLMNAEDTQNDYTFTVEATADAITPALLKGDIDVAMVPANLASVLYNKSEGALEVAAINTLGVLYIVEMGDSITSVADLKGKTIYSTGKGTTPEYALNYILTKNGLNPETDLTVEYKSEAAEVVAALVNDAAAIGVLPQPFVTAALSQNEGLRVALSLTEEWDKVSEGGAMVTGVMVVRRAFADENPDALNAFLTEYAASVEYVNANPAEAAAWIESLEIAKAAIAEKAIPACNIVCITGEEMQTKLSGYLTALYDQNPEAVGGTLPAEDFYYLP